MATGKFGKGEEGRERDDAGSAVAPEEMGQGAGKITDGVATYSGEAYMMGMKMKTRETMGAKGPKEGFHKLEIDLGKGFTLMGEDNCKK